MKRALAFILAVAFGTLQSAAEPARVTVFAAASLGGVLQDIAQEYRRDTDHTVVFSFGGSGVMAHPLIWSC
jgi:ABC-type molybdate transport system substrate-binding protein